MILALNLLSLLAPPLDLVRPAMGVERDQRLQIARRQEIAYIVLRCSLEDLVHVQTNQLDKIPIRRDPQPLTLKNLPPPGDTSNMLAILPHLSSPALISIPRKEYPLQVSPVAIIWCAPDCTQFIVVHY